jgi:hypothetical protein
MTSQQESSRQSVAVIGPKFGTASQAIDEAIRNHVGNENVQSLWYEESAFERRIGRFLGRLVRVVTQVLPLPQKVRSAAERFIGAVRFRRVDSVKDQLAWARSLAPVDHLILVKPMFLRPSDLAELRQTSRTTRVTVVLWDAIWRTPSIRSLLSGARVFSTEPTDCQSFGFTFLPVPPVKSRDTSALNNASDESSRDTSSPKLESSNCEQPIRLFFCGSWSLDRWLAARRLKTAVRSLENNFAKHAVGSPSGRHFVCELHLVTTNSLAAWLTRSVSASPAPLCAAEYVEFVKRCDVLLDFGRTGQSSPSERLSTAAMNGKILVTTNAQLAHLGLPVVTIRPKGWIEGLVSCERVMRNPAAIQRLWSSNSPTLAFMTTMDGWASTVFPGPDRQPSSPSADFGGEVSEPLFSFVQQVSKMSERIPV